MDLLRITNTTTWLPDLAILDYTSLIWTERFLDFGEFELKTPNVNLLRTQLPLNSFVTLQDSREVMIVETHTIKTDADGNSELTITGRSFDSILENKVIRGSYQNPTKTEFAMTASYFLALYLWNELGNTTGIDELRESMGTKGTENVIPNIGYIEDYSWNQPIQYWWVEDGPMAKQVRDVMLASKLGLKTVRPLAAPANETMYMVVYTADNRTALQTELAPVVFAHSFGNLASPSYLYSQKDYKNIAFLDCKLGSIQVYATPADEFTTGVNRRTLYVDGSDMINSTEQTFEQLLPALTQKAKQELAKYNRQFLFDVALTDDGPYTYGVDYGLGDLVTLRAEFGLEYTMRVTEYIRTEDLEGQKAYPTLIQDVPGA